MLEEAPDTRFADLLGIYTLGTESATTDRFLLGGATGLSPLSSSTSTRSPSGLATLFSVEIEGRDVSREDLESAVAELASAQYLAGSIVSETLSTAHLTKRIVEALDAWTATVFGIDPDYFFGVVPLEAPGHKQIESYVLGLKPSRTPREKLTLLVKRVMIQTGFTSPLYERFATILEKTRCS